MHPSPMEFILLGSTFSCLLFIFKGQLQVIFPLRRHNNLFSVIGQTTILVSNLSIDLLSRLVVFPAATNLNLKPVFGSSFS